MPGARRRTQARRTAPRRAARSRTRRVRRRRSPPLAAIWSLRLWRLVPLHALDQRARDVLGLALLALGIFAGFVLAGDWDGAGAFHTLDRVPRFLLGLARGFTLLAPSPAG